MDIRAEGSVQLSFARNKQGVQVIVFRGSDVEVSIYGTISEEIMDLINESMAGKTYTLEIEPGIFM